MPQGEYQRLKTCCPKGHPYSGDNLYVTPTGERQCRTCKRQSKRKSNKANPRTLAAKCKRGHFFCATNTYTDAKGTRHCRKCRALLGKVAYWKDRPREHTETSKALVDTMAFKDYRLRKPRPRKVEWSEIVRTYDNGAKTAKQVAEELNLNDNWVRSVLRREGVFKPRKVHVGITKEQVLDAFANGCTSANELGKALGCCSEQARRWAKKVNRKFPKRNARWTEELIERVRKLAALDITSKIISNILGGTPSASAIVHAHSIYDLGLLPSAGRKVTYISPGKRIEHNPNWKEQYRDELSVS